MSRIQGTFILWFITQAIAEKIKDTVHSEDKEEQIPVMHGTGGRLQKNQHAPRKPTRKSDPAKQIVPAPKATPSAAIESDPVELAQYDGNTAPVDLNASSTVQRKIPDTFVEMPVDKHLAASPTQEQNRPVQGPSLMPGVLMEGLSIDVTRQPNEKVRQYLKKTRAYIMVVTHGSLPVSDELKKDKTKKEEYLREALRQPNDPNALHMQELYETAAAKTLAYVLGLGLSDCVVGVGYDGDGFVGAVPQTPTAMALHVMMKLKSKGYHPYLLEAQVVGYSNPPQTFFNKGQKVELQIDGQKVPVDVFEEGGANVLHYPYVKDATTEVIPDELKESSIGLANPKHGAWESKYGGTAGNPPELAGSTAAHAAFLRTYGDFPACLIAAWDDRLAARPYEESICHSTVSACLASDAPESLLFTGKDGRFIEVREHHVSKDGVVDGPGKQEGSSGKQEGTDSKSAAIAKGITCTTAFLSSIAVCALMD